MKAITLQCKIVVFGPQISLFFQHKLSFSKKCTIFRHKGDKLSVPNAEFRERYAQKGIHFPETKRAYMLNMTRPCRIGATFVDKSV